MAINRKCLKIIDPNDRISSLPENLISHILSFLPTKYAVRTSALSTFWKDQWTSIPNLNFDDQLLADPQKNSTDKCTEMSFINFVYRVLVLHKAPVIHRFRLRCGQPYDDSHLNTWVSAALSRSVQEIDLFIPGAGRSLIPCQLFTHSTLVKFKMDSELLVVLKVPSLVYLQRLKVIHLSSVIFADDESSYRLFSGCPVLENLMIIYCTWESGTVLNISSPTLKSLTIRSPCINGDNRYKVELDTPSLLHLTYYDEELPNCAFKKMHFLVKARLHIDYQDGPESDDRINEITEGISKVQSLYLSGEFCEAVVCAGGRLSTFHNLTCLSIGYNNHGAWKLLPELLVSSPKLKHFVLNDGLFGKDMGRCNEYEWCPPKSVPACLSHHLKVMKVLAFDGHPEEMKMVKYILMEAKVLRTLIIELESDMMNAQEGFKVSKELLTFQRGSIACKVMIS